MFELQPRWVEVCTDSGAPLRRKWDAASRKGKRRNGWLFCGTCDILDVLLKLRVSLTVLLDITVKGDRHVDTKLGALLSSQRSAFNLKFSFCAVRSQFLAPVCWDRCA